jgi:hypothetical protein
MPGSSCSTDNMPLGNIAAFSEYSLTLHANNLGVEYERKYDYITPSGRKPAF